MTPEPLGPFMPRPVPICACHPEPIDGWLTSFHPSLVVPTLHVYVEDRPPLSWKVPCVHLHLCHCISQLTEMPETLLSKGHMTCQSPCPIIMSDPDTSLPQSELLLGLGFFW